MPAPEEGERGPARGLGGHRQRERSERSWRRRAVWVWVKIKPRGKFHLPWFHFGYLFLTHTHVFENQRLKAPPGRPQI